MRLPMIDPATATGPASGLLKETQAQLGRVPNLYRSMANSPAALSGYLNFRGALVKGDLSNAMREKLALLTAELNGCEYCVSAHTFRGGKIGIEESELAASRRAESADPKDAAALRFAAEVLVKQGRISDDELEQVRAAGWSDSEIGEIVAHVALNVFSNYFNHVAQPTLDFPRVPVQAHG